jgi:hypothetical protein
MPCEDPSRGLQRQGDPLWPNRKSQDPFGGGHQRNAHSGPGVRLMSVLWGASAPLHSASSDVAVAFASARACRQRVTRANSATRCLSGTRATDHHSADPCSVVELSAPRSKSVHRELP